MKYRLLDRCRPPAGGAAEQKRQQQEVQGGSLQMGWKQCGTITLYFESQAQKISRRHHRDPRELRQFSEGMSGEVKRRKEKLSTERE